MNITARLVFTEIYFCVEWEIGMTRQWWNQLINHPNPPDFIPRAFIQPLFHDLYSALPRLPAHEFITQIRIRFVWNISSCGLKYLWELILKGGKTNMNGNNLLCVLEREVEEQLWARYNACASVQLNIVLTNIGKWGTEVSMCPMNASFASLHSFIFWKLVAAYTRVNPTVINSSNNKQDYIFSVMEQISTFKEDIGVSKHGTC